jgi:hypothetical protein
VLVFFLGFQMAQAFHTHANALPQKDCPVCQVVHQTPSLAAAPHVFSFQGFAAEWISLGVSCVVIPPAPAPLFFSRAPPLA